MIYLLFFYLYPTAISGAFDNILAINPNWPLQHNDGALRMQLCGGWPEVQLEM
ncbi:hypothetical protein HMPREF9135_0955 [Segatella baroniae F0067]|uniref:Uncharacterized protein n=1 Tax=Segatella baroniae F0067 TaxID=1115809 RepID=U2P2C1_9BACT|nr:hypothetical protein HMPREF9135_0955 [Segatella baroniae F0067]